MSIVVRYETNTQDVSLLFRLPKLKKTYNLLIIIRPKFFIKKYNNNIFFFFFNVVLLHLEIM